MEFLEDGWREPDDGIWEVRGPRRHFTHSKVMAWVAIDRAIKTAEEFGLEGPVDAWKKIRQEIHDQVCDEGFNADKGSFTQYYGSDELDASLLMIPLVGFLPAHDPRVRGTIEAVERELVDGGFVLRYRTDDTGRRRRSVRARRGLSGLLVLAGRLPGHAGPDHDARQLLDRLLALRNDLGLLSEEYDAVAGRLVGNFPQAFSHVSLVNSASKLAGMEKPSSGHVILGLARRSLTKSKSNVPSRHAGAALGPEHAGQAGGERQPLRGPGGGPHHRSRWSTASPGDRGKPTTKPSERRPTKLATKAPVKATEGGQVAKPAKATARKLRAHSQEGPGDEGRSRRCRPRRLRPRRAAVKKAPAKKAERPRRNPGQEGRSQEGRGQEGERPRRRARPRRRPSAERVRSTRADGPQARRSEMRST